MNGCRLLKNIQVWKKRDEAKKERLEGFIHKDNMKKMNRDRILKILNYESEHYWFTPENIEERLLEESIQPEFAGSTEHYQLLTQQALAYERLDFDNLEVLQSDEHTMRFKNRLLIPIYNEIINLVKAVKSNEFKDNEVDYKSKVERIERLYNLEEMKEEKEIQLTRAREEYQRVRAELLKKMETPANRESFIKEKIVQIRNLLFFWKQYSKVLNLSNVEIELVRKKGEIDKKLSKIASKLATKEYKMRKEAEKSAVFAHVQEANTEEEDDQVDMREFLRGSDETEQAYGGKVKINMEDMQRLDELLDSSEHLVTELKQEEEKPSKKLDDRERLGLYRDLNTPLETNTPIPEKDRFKENSSVLIESWKKLTKDPELRALLDEVGETHVDQSALFWKVFMMH